MKKKIYAIATRTRKGTLRRVPDTRFDTEESARRYGEKYHKGKSGERFYEVVEHPDSKKRNLEEISIAKASDYIIDSGRNMMTQYDKRKKMREKGTQNSAEYKDTDRKLDNRTNGMRRATDIINKKIGMMEDWQKVNRQDKTDGLSQKAVNAYRRENPGSKLKTAVTEKNPTGKRASRRKSFCSRMSGMKARLTSAKTARDPDSRINKALRRWNCREETANEACWDGYKMEGMKKKGNRTVPNCVKVEENDPCWKGYEMIGMKKKKGRPVPNCVKTEEAGGMSVGAGLIAGMGGSANGPGTGDSKMSAFKREPGVSKKNQARHGIMRREDFAGAVVFEVSSSTFHNAKMEKRKGKHWRTYLDECDELSEIREYANKNPGKPIVLQNRTTTEMVYVRYGKKQ